MSFEFEKFVGSISAHAIRGAFDFITAIFASTAFTFLMYGQVVSPSRLDLREGNTAAAFNSHVVLSLCRKFGRGLTTARRKGQFLFTLSDAVCSVLELHLNHFKQFTSGVTCRVSN